LNFHAALVVGCRLHPVTASVGHEVVDGRFALLGVQTNGEAACEELLQAWFQVGGEEFARIRLISSQYVKRASVEPVWPSTNAGLRDAVGEGKHVTNGKAFEDGSTTAGQLDLRRQIVVMWAYRYYVEGLSHADRRENTQPNQAGHVGSISIQTTE
jgi:hypothetical protein